MDACPLVSVIVPVYNTEQFLRECMESILGQTFRDFEVICVDDGSTDSSLSILREYESEDERVIVLTQQNAYAGAARNNGMAIAKGEYLLFLDSDDCFASNMIEVMVDRAQATDADAVICHSMEYDNATGKRTLMDYSLRHLDCMDAGEVFSGEDAADQLFQFCVGWPWDKLFSRRFIDETGLRFQEQRTTNDAYFVFLALAKAHRIAVVDDCLAYHRVNNMESISNTRSKSYRCAFAAMDAIREKLIADGMFPLFEQSFVNWQVHFSLWNFNTLRGDAQNAVGRLIGEKIRPQVFVRERPDDYFYNESEVRQFREVSSFETWLGLDDVPALAARAFPAAPAISVIVPICNVDHYLFQALDSLEAQTFTDIEFICVNDGSRDNSLTISKLYEQRDPRFVVVNKANAGYGHAMNVGMACARGTYIGILEPDDYVEPNMFQDLYEAAEKSGAQVVRSDFHRFRGIDETFECWLDRVGAFEGEDDSNYNRLICPREERGIFLYPMNTWCGIYRCDFLEQHGIRHNETPGASFQDNGLWFESYAFADRLLLISKPAYMNRRDNPGSSMNDPRKAEAPCTEYLLIRDFMKKTPEVFEKIKTVLWVKYLMNFNASLERTDPSLCEGLLRRGQKDIKMGFEENEIDLDDMPDWAREDLLAIVEDPIAYFFGRLKQWHSDDTDCINAMRKEIDSLRGEVDRLRGEADGLHAEIERIYASHSFKMGNAFMRGPRALKSLAGGTKDE